MSDTITISKSELERLVAIEIAKQTLPRVNRDFRNIAIDGQDIAKVNEQHPTIQEKLKHIYTNNFGNVKHFEELRGYGENNINHIFKRNRRVFGHGEYVHYKVFDRDVHETLRKLSVQLMGGSIIRDLEPDELDFALNVYEDFKQLFLEKYNQRLDFEEERSND